jgi:hypothetical protein
MFIHERINGRLRNHIVGGDIRQPDIGCQSHGIGIQERIPDGSNNHGTYALIGAIFIDQRCRCHLRFINENYVD